MMIWLSESKKFWNILIEFEVTIMQKYIFVTVWLIFVQKECVHTDFCTESSQNISSLYFFVGTPTALTHFQHCLYPSLCSKTFVIVIPGSLKLQGCFIQESVVILSHDMGKSLLWELNNFHQPHNSDSCLVLGSYRLLVMTLPMLFYRNLTIYTCKLSCEVLPLTKLGGLGT